MSKVRRDIIREWMSLTGDKRQSSAQASAFAKAALQRHHLPRSRRTPHAIVMQMAAAAHRTAVISAPRLATW